MRTAIEIWEDEVGDSGEVPTEEELKKFYSAILEEVHFKIRELNCG